MECRPTCLFYALQDVSPPLMVQFFFGVEHDGLEAVGLLCLIQGHAKPVRLLAERSFQRWQPVVVLPAPCTHAHAHVTTQEMFWCMHTRQVLHLGKLLTPRSVGIPPARSV